MVRLLSKNPFLKQSTERDSIGLPLFVKSSRFVISMDLDSQSVTGESSLGALLESLDLKLGTFAFEARIFVSRPRHAKEGKGVVHVMDMTHIC
jgi:hypothetical protein